MSVHKHLETLKKMTGEIRSKWFDLGVELGISINSLQEIQHLYKHDADRYTALLTNWLSQTELVPKWSTLIKALRSSRIQRDDIASHIEALQFGQGFELKILEHPQDVTCKPGEKVELLIKTEPIAREHKWYFEESEITANVDQLEGFSTSLLTIKKCLPKHKGSYKCLVTDETGKSLASLNADVMIDGEVIEMEESKLLGAILSRLNVNCAAKGINVPQLSEGGGSSNLTYEEVEFVMCEDPATEFLSENLKEKLKSRLEEEKLYKEALKNDDSVSISYTKILALGPGQVGKSTFLYRLMGLMKGNIQTADPETQPQRSTGINEQREACIQYISRTTAVTSEEWQVFDELNTQLTSLIHLISEQTQLKKLVNVPAKESSQASSHEDTKTETEKGIVCKETKADEGKEVATKHGEQNLQLTISAGTTEEEQVFENKTFDLNDSEIGLSDTTVLSEADINAVVKEFNSLQDKCIANNEQVKPDILLNVADIGGQPAFLEMLPSLTIGPALYLVFMHLEKGLETIYPVVFKCKGNQQQVVCQNYTYTTEEVIFTALSSIASFGNSDEEVEMYVSKEDSQQQSSSLALLAGTFADKVSDKEVAELHHQIKKLVQETDHYTKKNLLYDTKPLKINNYSAENDELKEQRSFIVKLLQRRFRKYQIPARWLMLSICLKLLAQKLNTFELSFTNCVQIGRRCFGMNEETVHVALKFLHKYIGLVMYFPNNPHLKDVVICDPKIVFSSLSELIFDIYDPSKKYVSEAKYDHFVETGCFSPQDILPIEKSDEKNLLSIDTVAKLLLHLNIVAEVPQSDSKDKKEYFLPAVLQTAGTDVLKMSPEGENEQSPEPLCIRFVTGYLPLGFVCALSANLMACNPQLKLIFKEDNQPIAYKNMMKFRYEGEIDIIMISGPKYCEFHIKRISSATTKELSDYCPVLRTIICKAAARVVESMQHGDSVYKLSTCFELAFKCPDRKHKNAEFAFGHEPLAKFVYEGITVSSDTSTRKPNKIQCVIPDCVTSSPLTTKMKVWFGRDVPLEIIMQPKVRDDNVIVMKVKGTEPINYQWFKDDDKITDGNDFKGCDGHELFVRSLEPHVNGSYHCEVKNLDKPGHCVRSVKIKFDPFEIKLKQGGLNDKDIRALIDDNGFSSMKDLQDLSLEDVDELDGLKKGQKISVKKFLKKLHQQDESSSGFQSTLQLKDLKDVFWKVRANWYLLGIQLDVEHSELEVARRKAEVYDKYMFVLQSFLNRKSPPPSWTDVKLALESVLVGQHDFNVSPEVQEQLEQLSCESESSDPKPNCGEGSQLKKVLTALWEVRAKWRQLAGEIEKITEGDSEAISANHSSVEDCFAALIHKCLTTHQESAHEELLRALRSQTIGRCDLANDFEKNL